MARTSLIMALPDMVLVVHRDGRILDSLGGRTFSFDLGPEAWEGQSVEQVLPAGVAQQLQSHLARVLRTRQPVTDITRADDGRDFELRLSVHGRERVLCVVRDLSGEHQTAAEYLQTASTTGETLARDTFLHLLNDAVNTSRMSERPLALLAIGFMGYEEVCHSMDGEGQSILARKMSSRIDGVLADASERLGAMVSTQLSVEQFAVLASSVTGGEQALEIAQALSESLAKPYNLDAREITLRPAVGVAVAPQDGNSGEHLLRNAMTAMEESAMLDRSGIERYTDTRRLRTERRQDLIEELRWAISEDQLTLHYQPVFQLRDARPVAIEAFLRWQHPLRGVLNAAEFVPLAEATGQIQKISEWALAQACRDLMSIRASSSMTLSVSVNLSRHYFSRLDLLDSLNRVFEETCFDPAWLQLDITERMLMRPEQVGPVLGALKKLGIGLQVDDFGSGYTSLKQMRRFPLDALKIDGDFIGGIGRSPDDEAVCRSVIALAHAYGMRCIAEAVETSTQVRFLRDAGCDDIQGSLFSREMPLDALEVFLEQFHQGRNFESAAEDTDIAAL
ncbi:MAG: EAL domain-containing protein [Pseudomonadota bacterium]